MTKKHYVKIRCPRCGRIVRGIITERILFLDYYGYCQFCDYHITESEFEEVE